MRQHLSHWRIDEINAAQDRKVAALLRRDGRLLKLARSNLARWMARDGKCARPVFEEWHGILTRLSRAEISDFLRSDSPMARRLRQSSPFAGLLNETDHLVKRQRHAKKRA